MLTFVYKVNRMFLEKNKIKKGSIEVICGSMFSGKTEELIRRIDGLKLLNKVLLFVNHQLKIDMKG